MALMVASGASARDVHVHVNVKDQHGYRMSIEASRSFGRVISIATAKIEGAQASAPVRAVSRKHVADAAQKAKASESKPRPHSGFLSVQVQNHHAISTYNVQGTVTHNRLFANLGDLGRISLHFHLRHTRTTHHGCLRQHERLGMFKGRVRFRGENDYVNVDARKLRGKVELQGSHRHRCGGIAIAVPAPRGHHHKAQATAKPGSSRHHRERYTLFYADRDSRSNSTLFAAIKETRGDAAFLTERFELREPVFIDREEYRDGKAGDFHTAKGLKAARIEPSPRAYRGTGHFKARHHGTRWKGSLATSFPGASHVRLAGPNFTAKLRRLGLFY